MSINKGNSDEQNKSNGHISVEKSVTAYIFYQYGDMSEGHDLRRICVNTCHGAIYEPK